MKIIRLKALNINSLKGNTDIDFEKISHTNTLFIITGPTGCGKSSILDIITCALYGRTPRLKNPNALLTKGCAEAYCEVEFEINNKRYRSSWSQKRARKKHDGKFQTAKMQLVSLDENRIFDLKSREVPKKVEEICGLDFVKFTQSMMLAQGDFDAFLKADEKERSSLLEKITGTQIYSTISAEVYESFSKAQQEINTLKSVLESTDIMDEMKLQAKITLLNTHATAKYKEEIKLKEINSSIDFLQKLTELDEEQKFYGNSLKTLNSDIQHFSKLYEQHSKKLQEEKIKLDAQLEKIQKAKELEIREKNCNNTLKRLKLSLEEKNLTFSNTKKKFEELKKQYEELEQKQEFTKEYLQKHKEDAKLSSRLPLIKQYINTYKEEFKNLQKNKSDLDIVQTNKKREQRTLQQLNQELKLHKKILEETLQKYEKIIQKVTLNRDRKNILDKDIQTNRNLIEKFDLLQSMIEEKKQTNKMLEDFFKEQKNLSKLKDSLTEHISEIKEHLKTLKEKEQREYKLKNYEKDRLLLKDGEACFLCGSLQHPYTKKTPEIFIDDTKKLIETKKEQLTKKEAELQHTIANLSKLHSNIEFYTIQNTKLDAQINDIEKLFGNTVEKNTKEKLKNAIKNIQKELFSIEEDIAEKEKLLVQKEALYKEQTLKEQNLNIINITLEKLDAQKQHTDSLLKNTEKKLLKLQKNLDTELAEFFKSPKIQELDKYEQNLQKREKEYKENENRLQKNKNKLDDIQKKQLESKSITDLLKYEIDSINTEIKMEEKELNQILKKRSNILKTDNLDSYEKTLKQNYEKTNRQTQNTKNRLDALKFEYTHISKVKQSIKTKAKEIKTKLDILKTSYKNPQNVIQNLKNTLLPIERNIQKLSEEIGSIKTELQINQNNLQKYKEQLNSLEIKAKEFDTLAKLNELIGSADGAKFKKFAQSITLEQLVFLANRHLAILNPRYTLMQEKKNILTLCIADNYQAQTQRGVNTLSGGESFVVSLSLALGLSELASQKISIDSLFLDEGFGTLDEESLEMALNALGLIQSNGKTVGIISHINTLKERIPTQIKVVPNGDGTSFVQI